MNEKALYYNNYDLLKKIIGIRGANLPPADLLKTISSRLSLEVPKKFWEQLEYQRLKARGLQFLTSFSAIAALSILSNPDIPPLEKFLGTVLCAVIGTETYKRSGRIASENAEISQGHLLAMASQINNMNLGEAGKKTSKVLQEIAMMTSEERNLYGRPVEIVINLLLQSAVIISVSPDKITPVVALLMSLGLTEGQAQVVRKKFIPSQEQTIDSRREYISNPTKSQLGEEYELSAKNTAKNTELINAFAKLFTFLAYYISYQGGAGSLIGYTSTQLQSNFTSVTHRLMDIKKAAKHIEYLLKIAPELIDELAKLILNEDDLQAHIIESADPDYRFPEDLKDRFGQFEFSKALVINAELLLKHSKKILKAIIPIDKTVYLIGQNGSGKTSFFDMIFHRSKHKHRGEVGIAVKNKSVDIQNLHEIPYHELKDSFLIWKQKDFDTTTGSFLSLVGWDNQEKFSEYIKELQGKQSYEILNMINELLFKRNVFSVDLGTDTLSDGQRYFLMITAFLIKAKESGVKYIFLDEPYKSLDNQDSSLRSILQYLIDHLQSSGISIFISLQNKEDLPKNLNRDQIIDFDRNYIMHMPQFNNKVEYFHMMEKLFIPLSDFDEIPDGSLFIAEDNGSESLKYPEWAEALIRGDEKAVNLLCYLIKSTDENPFTFIYQSVIKQSDIALNQMSFEDKKKFTKNYLTAVWKLCRLLHISLSDLYQNYKKSTDKTDYRYLITNPISRLNEKNLNAIFENAIQNNEYQLALAQIDELTTPHENNYNWKQISYGLCHLTG